MNQNLFDDYRHLVLESIGNDFNDNHDVDRFGPLGSGPTRNPHPQFSFSAMKAAIRRLLSRTKQGLLNILRTGCPTLTEAGQAEQWIKPNIHRLQWVYDHLKDAESKRVLVEVLAYRALGHRRVKLRLNTPDYWQQRNRIKNLRSVAETMPTGFGDRFVYRTDLRSFGYPLELFVRGIQTQFLLEQYRCPLPSNTIEVADGDVVIDAGGCYGDTALYFAFKAGPQGRVYSFEFLPENLTIFNRNLELNNDYARRIHLVKQPVWSSSNEALFVVGRGPSTQVVQQTKDRAAVKVRTLSIDDLVEREKLDHLDFIKMDIEGSELAALMGAEQSIRRFRPKLAICVYHRLRDFWEIPQWIDGLGLGYRFHLRHFTIHLEETVLFAEAEQ